MKENGSARPKTSSGRFRMCLKFTQKKKQRTKGQELTSTQILEVLDFHTILSLQTNYRLLVVPVLKKSLLKYIIASSFTNPLQEAMDKLNSFNEKYGLGTLSSTHSGSSEEDFQINTVDRR